MAKVFMLSNQGHDLSNAGTFGELVVIKEGNYQIFNPSIVLSELRTAFQGKFRDEDFLIMSGSPFVSALAMSMLFMMGSKKVNVLLFDAKKREYFPRTITDNQLD